MSAMMLISSIIVRRRSVVSGFWNRYRMFTSLPRVVFNTRDDCNRSSCMRVDPLFTSILKFWVYLHSGGRGERGDLSSLKAEDLLSPLQREGREILTVWELRIYCPHQTVSLWLCLGTSSSWLCPVRDCLLETVFWRLLLETVLKPTPQCTFIWNFQDLFSYLTLGCSLDLTLNFKVSSILVSNFLEKHVCHHAPEIYVNICI